MNRIDNISMYELNKDGSVKFKIGDKYFSPHGIIQTLYENTFANLSWEDRKNYVEELKKYFNDMKNTLHSDDYPVYIDISLKENKLLIEKNK